MPCTNVNERCIRGSLGPRKSRTKSMTEKDEQMTTTGLSDEARGPIITLSVTVGALWMFVCAKVRDMLKLCEKGDI